METKTILCCLVCLALPAALHAAILTVDNNEGHPADFRTIQAAVDAAAVGDTIYVAGSTAAYSGFTATKLLYIKGQGAGALSHEVNLGGTASFTEIFDVQSPDHLRNASGSLLEGMTGLSVAIYGMCSGVTIKRCDTSSITLFGCSGAAILGCRAGGGLSLGSWWNQNSQRNYLGTGNTIVGTWANAISFAQPANTLVENCVFGVYVGGATQTAGPVFTTPTLADTSPFVLRNTILIGKTSVFNNTNSGNARAVFDHCLSIGGTVLPAENGNLSVAYTQFPNVFVSAVVNATSPETFLLKAGSPAIGAGLAGVDMGMYGGSSPFVKDFVPALPRINYLAVPPLVPDTTGLTFEVRAEARD